MLDGRTIAVIVPCFNEERMLPGVLATMPSIVDRVIVVDDASGDRTCEIARQRAACDPRVVLIEHERNQGVGGSLATGYQRARDDDFDVAVVMGGDGQMDPADFLAIVRPVIAGDVDCAKGNRLLSPGAFNATPRDRFVGNAVLSLLTKVASGYWHIADSQNGYTAINRAVLHTIDWDRMYKGYGQPNDLLVRLNVHNFRVGDVVMAPVYGRGEVSKMKKRRVVFTISWLLVRLFCFRLKEKYVVRDFHPLVFFWMLAFVLLPASVLLFIRLLVLWAAQGQVPEITLLSFGFCFISGMQSMCFALLFDMQNNRTLRSEPSRDPWQRR
jgi:glycosyltransferase involved in cell wall biosynthesis